jgi:hypothetical protein
MPSKKRKRVTISTVPPVVRQLSATSGERAANTWPPANEYQNRRTALAERGVAEQYGVPPETFAGDGLAPTGPELKKQLRASGAWSHGRHDEQGKRNPREINDFGEFAGGKRKKRRSKKNSKKSIKRKTNKKRRHR